MKKNILSYLFFLIALLLITGCSTANNNKQSTTNKENNEELNNDHKYHAENGDLRELTANIDKLPQFLNDKPEEMKVIYAAAAKNKELLEYIPCYCGCGESANHKDNFDCFVYENKDNGEVVWDDHGTRCGVCLETAAETVIQYKDGKSLKEIREYIDEKYKEGYAKPTKTKMPS